MHLTEDYLHYLMRSDLRPDNRFQMPLDPGCEAEIDKVLDEIGAERRAVDTRRAEVAGLMLENYQRGEREAREIEALSVEADGARETGLTRGARRAELAKERRHAAASHRRRHAEEVLHSLRYKFKGCLLPESAPSLDDDHALLVYPTAIAADREHEAGIPRRLGPMSAVLTQWPG